MSEILDIAIIGAGPGGLGAATNAAHHGLSHILFEKREIGNTIYDYQLRKLVMAEPRRLPLRAYVSFVEGSREEVLSGFERALNEKKVQVCKGEVSQIQKDGDVFILTSGTRQFKAKNVVLAIGNMGTPRKMGAPGEDLPHIAYTLSDPAAFTNLNIVVIGAGDSAIENALALREKNRVSIVNRRGEFPRAKDANRRKILDAVKKGEINCFYDTKVKECTSEILLLETPEGEVAIPADHIIVRAGNAPPRMFIESCGIEFPSPDPSSYPKVSDTYESNVPGLFIIGALIGYPLIKQAINQGHEVVEHILGNPIEPADMPLIEEVVSPLGLGASEALLELKTKLPLFKSLGAPQFREMLIDSTIHACKERELVFEKNAFGDTFWNIISGSVGVVSPETGEVVYTLSQGSFFGEMGLISGRRRSATIVALEKGTILLETKRNQILKLMASAPEVKRSIDSVFFMRILKTSVFPSADSEDLADIIKHAEQVQYKKGEILFSEGDSGDALYIVLKGSVKVSRKNNKGDDVAQTYLAAGSYVGEMALVSEAPRSATVSAAVRSDILKIPREKFAFLLEKNPETGREVRALATKRTIQNLTALRDDRSGQVLDFVLKEGVSDANNVLLIDSDLCVSCDNCEKACASTHGGYSRLDRKKGKSFASIQVPVSCRHCENPLCMLDCPPDALTRLQSGEVVIRDTCIGCGNCVSNCPYDVIQLVYDNKNTSLWSSPFSLFSLFSSSKKKEKGPAKAAKCDMCADLDGGPACVRSCPTGAAMRVDPKEMMSLLMGKKE